MPKTISQPPVSPFPPRPVDRAAFLDRAATAGVPTDRAEKALANISSGSAIMIAMSGKIASGKDTVAPALLDRLGAARRQHHYFAGPLKDELDAIIAAIRASDLAHTPALTKVRRDRLARDLEVQFALPKGSGALYAGRLADQVLMHRHITSRTRTSVMRHVQQQHGTQVRRAQDPDYWVKRATVAAVNALAAGESVFLTDMRFGNEAQCCSDLGGWLIRLDVDRVTRVTRLHGRDGHLPTSGLDVAEHPSETALDDYELFDIRIDNSGPLTGTLDILAGRITGAGAHADAA